MVNSQTLVHLVSIKKFLTSLQYLLSLLKYLLLCSHLHYNLSKPLHTLPLYYQALKEFK